MNQQQIDVFVAVMRLGSVTAAAQHLGMAQPSVSKSIAMAERLLGFSLFQRRKGRLVPTPEAALVFEEASRIQADMARFRRYLVNVGQFRVGRLRVGATPSLAIGMCTMAARLFRRQFPDHGLMLDMHANHEIREAVQRRQFDVGLMVAPSNGIHGEDLEILRTSPMVCVLPAGHGLARKRTVQWRDIEPRELIYITTDSRIIDRLTAQVPDFRHRSASSLETNRYNVALNLVRQGLGLTIIDAFTLIGTDLSDVVVRPFTPAVAVSLAAVIDPHSASSTPAHAFVEALRAVLP